MCCEYVEVGTLFAGHDRSEPFKAAKTISKTCRCRHHNSTSTQIKAIAGNSFDPKLFLITPLSFRKYDTTKHDESNDEDMRDFLHFSRDHSSMKRELGGQKSTFAALSKRIGKQKR